MLYFNQTTTISTIIQAVIKTTAKVPLRIEHDYLSCDLQQTNLQCSNFYIMATWIQKDFAVSLILASKSVSNVVSILLTHPVKRKKISNSLRL